MTKSIVQIPENQGYWLVRTEGGRYYNDFFSNNFIAVGWDKFTDIDAFRSINDKASAREMIGRIKKAYPEKKRPQHDFNQILKFIRGIREDDFVIIPGYGSNSIAFGKVVSDAYIKKVNLTRDEERAGICPFYKRRSVEWLKTIKRDDLDPYLYKLFFSHHTISNAQDYGNRIDRTLYSLYLKGNDIHLIIDVKSKDKIYARDLTDLITGILNTAEDFNKLASLGVNLKEVEMGINVQSPGFVELTGKATVMLVIASALTFTVGGKYSLKVPGFEFSAESKGVIEKIIQYQKTTQQTNVPDKVQKQIVETQKLMNQLKVEIPKQLSPIVCHQADNI